MIVFTTEGQVFTCSAVLPGRVCGETFWDHVGGLANQTHLRCRSCGNVQVFVASLEYSPDPIQIARLRPISLPIKPDWKIHV